MLGSGPDGQGIGPLYGRPMAAMAPAMFHHTMQFDTLGYRRSFPYPTMAEPTSGLAGLFGCCDWCTDDRLGDTLSGCPGGPTVVVGSDMPEWFNYKLNLGGDQPIDIPGWLFWIAGAFALIHLLKRR